MTNNLYARFKGANVEHLLIPGTKETRCGKDATFANRYPRLTVLNSTDRRVYKRCAKCLDKA